MNDKSRMYLGLEFHFLENGLTHFSLKLSANVAQ